MNDSIKNPIFHNENMTDTEILVLYSNWSEEYYCASFLQPSPEAVKEFRNWLKNLHEQDWTSNPLQNYEQEMLKEFHKQEQ